jgi:raffinose/stachyose/melibiose transport system permease protein
VLEVLVGLCLAGLVSMHRGRLWFRVAIFTPVMLPMVVVAVLWAFVYNPDFGLLNGALEVLGLSSLQRVWLGDPSVALLAICVVSGWVYAGFYMMIFYAAFRQVPTDVIEAARLDGAGEWAIFRRVKVPMIRGAVGVAVLLCVTGGFQGFDLFFVMTNGGPYGATEIPTTLLVRTVFRHADVGYGSAMAVVLTAVVVACGLAYARLQARRAGATP